MATLYRKYRPQTFEEIVGQNHVKTTLENEIQTGRFAHAYLFCGPRAVGKTTLARLLAKAINCDTRKEGEYEPCNTCDHCREITEGKNMDIIEIDAASHTGVDNVRENIIGASRVAPSGLKYKVFIVDEVHMLSISAFNALLKVLEEPPANVVFVLCTTEVHKVPATIISRCERFDFKRVSISDIVKKLNYVITKEGIKVDKEILEAIARRSEGYVRDAESLLGQIVAISGREITREQADLVLPRSDIQEIINLINILGKKDTSRGVSLINNLVDSGVDLKRFTSDLIEVLRKMMLAKISPGLGDKLGYEIGESMELQLQDASQNIDLQQLVVFINRFIRARNELKNSFIIQLPLELAITELCYDSGNATKPAPGAQAGVPPRKDTPTAGPEPVAGKQNEGDPEQDKPATSQQPPDNLDQQAIASRWHEVLAKIKKHNHSLSFILRVCRPKELKGNCLNLVFKYKFHKDRVQDGKIREIIENTLQEVYGARLSIESEFDENLEINENNLASVDNSENNNHNSGEDQELKEDNQEQAPKNGNVVDDLLQTFGGKVVK
jgi:DNA polymerase-3 subunit gamma/tau